MAVADTDYSRLDSDLDHMDHSLLAVVVLHFVDIHSVLALQAVHTLLDREQADMRLAVDVMKPAASHRDDTLVHFQQRSVDILVVHRTVALNQDNCLADILDLYQNESICQ